MREIKFRAWNGSHMLSWGWLCDMGQVGSRFFDKDLPDRSYEVMQYTGLKDKTGKEIYEGDIIKHTRYGVEQNWEVVWLMDACGFSLTRLNQNMYLSRLCEPYCEVCGNIYENGELLT